jgi:hypothetical protein
VRSPRPRRIVGGSPRRLLPWLGCTDQATPGEVQAIREVAGGAAVVVAGDEGEQDVAAVGFKPGVAEVGVGLQVEGVGDVAELGGGGDDRGVVDAAGVHLHDLVGAAGVAAEGEGAGSAADDALARPAVAELERAGDDAVDVEVEGAGEQIGFNSSLGVDGEREEGAAVARAGEAVVRARRVAARGVGLEDLAELGVGARVLARDVEQADAGLFAGEDAGDVDLARGRGGLVEARGGVLGERAEAVSAGGDGGEGQFDEVTGAHAGESATAITRGTCPGRRGRRNNSGRSCRRRRGRGSPRGRRG